MYNYLRMPVRMQVVIRIDRLWLLIWWHVCFLWMLRRLWEEETGADHFILTMWQDLFFMVSILIYCKTRSFNWCHKWQRFLGIKLLSVGTFGMFCLAKFLWDYQNLSNRVIDLSLFSPHYQLTWQNGICYFAITDWMS